MNPVRNKTPQASADAPLAGRISNGVKYVFFGSAQFSTVILEKLAKAGFTPKAVVCNPDKPAGRKQIITPPPVKLKVQELNLETEVLQPAELNTAFFEKLKAVKADFYVVAAYSKILPRELLKIPPLGVIGVHPGLLPKFRGPSPIQTAILEGVAETGVTLFLLDEKVDHGPIIARSSAVAIDRKNFETLRAELANVAGELLIETIPKFLKREIQPIPQNDNEATHTKKFITEDAYVEPKELENALNGNFEIAVKIERMIRALNPEPGVWTYAKALANRHMRIDESKRIKILEAKVVDNQLKLVKIQEAGKKPVSL